MHTVTYISIAGRFADIQGAYHYMFACKGLINTSMISLGPYHICDRLYYHSEAGQEGYLCCGLRCSSKQRRGYSTHYYTWACHDSYSCTREGGGVCLMRRALLDRTMGAS